MSSIQTSTDFDVSSVQFGKFNKLKNGGKAVYLSGPGGSKVQLQLPFMRTPFGLSAYTDENSKKTTYSLDLSFDAGDSEVDTLMEKLGKLDEIVLNTVAANSQEWLGKKFNVAVLKEALHKPMIRAGKAEYPSTLKCKIGMDAKSGKFIPEAYNMKQQEVPLTSLEKGQRVMAIIELNQIWIVDNKFGVSVKLLQVLMEASKKLPKFAFKLPPGTIQEAAPEEASEEGEEEADEDQQETDYEDDV
jgi:hypothetical protein